jgi:peptidoglycan-associated lipoprotein
VSDSFNSGSVDEFADLGAPINDTLDDGLSLRDPTLSSFNDESATRPFEPVLFGFDQYNIQASERAKISRIADYMKTNPSARLLIEGYCDWKGTPDYNKSLGDRRAKTVKEYLTDLGCEENRIEVISIGDELATPNASSEIARLDRRATFVVSE